MATRRSRRPDTAGSSSSSTALLHRSPNARNRSASEGTLTTGVPLHRQPAIPGSETNIILHEEPEPLDEYSWKYFKYPDDTFVPSFNRRQVTMIGISE
ncbi:hypothetical protein FRB95_003551 [Tulasnella sp. JGI-2019a]|nr:hypothetical protein FRB95_003551 [Tulasnella sp. JGI-2019a]